MNLHTRPIRSFVLRQGRVSQAQRRAIDELWPLHGLEFSSAWLDWHTVFGRHSPRILEIGFGMGETTAQIAASQPETDFLAIDVHTPGVGSLLKQIDAQRLKNLRIMRHDAVEVMRHMIAPASLAGLHVFFPDPWPKKRHHKRRLLQPEFVSLTAARIAPGGYIHVATDWEDYARQILAVLSAEPLLANTAADFAPRPQHRPLTKFEQRGIKLGHQVWDVVFTRR